MDPLDIESLDQDGRGVARRDGKTVFVEGALPGERVLAETVKRKPSWEKARAVTLLRESAQRVRPRCPHFGVCGGCSLQHLDASAQVAVKQRVLEDALWHLGRVRPERVLPAIQGPAWGYRQRARLSVRNVPKKGGVLVGFHERASSYVADMLECPVLPPRVGALLPHLRALVGGLSAPDRIPQIELAHTEASCALVLRHLLPLTHDDRLRLATFAREHAVDFWLQPAGPDSIVPFGEAPAPLTYRLAEFDVEIAFLPTDFTQVNSAVNEVLVRHALGALDPRHGERVADFFCGLGNFTLPIARRGAQVVGVEGSRGLLERAAENARRNGLGERTTFEAADLFQVTAEQLAGWGRFDKLLVDPPREGAIALVKALTAPLPSRIVYVSCNPATLARDAAVLTQQHGYRLRAAGVANMFPHTAHVESIAWFELGDARA